MISLDSLADRLEKAHALWKSFGGTGDCRETGKTTEAFDLLGLLVVDNMGAILAALRSSASAREVETIDFRAHLQRQRDWSGKTFSPGPRTAGVIDHIRKELNEIEANPSDISEWIDVVILGLVDLVRALRIPTTLAEPEAEGA